MTTALEEIQNGLEDRLKTIPGLRTAAYYVDAPNPPQAVVGDPRIAYDLTMGRGADTYQFTITLVVQRGTDRTGNAALAAYCASAGTQSIKAAIEDDDTLGGVAMTAVVTSMGDWGVIEIEQVPYLGCQFQVQVIANG